MTRYPTTRTMVMDAPASDFLAALRQVILAALAEDQASADLTTSWTVPEHSVVEAEIVCKEEGVLAGIEFVAEVYRQVDPEVVVHHVASDGDSVRPLQQVALIRGPARSVITGERTALNLLQRAAGIATSTNAFLRELEDTDVLLRDTRKTAPGLRQLDKYSVRCGGGSNHRMGVNDMIFLKENHLRAAGGLTAAAEAVRRNMMTELRASLLIEAEVTSIPEVAAGLDCQVDWLLLDNMTIADNEAGSPPAQ